MKVLSKIINPNTGENIFAQIVNTWLDGTELTPQNEANYLGGLFNKDLETGEYFKYSTTGAFPISRLSYANHSTLQKLINDFNEVGGGQILIDVNINLDGSILIVYPKVQFKYDFGSNAKITNGSIENRNSENINEFAKNPVVFDGTKPDIFDQVVFFGEFRFKNEKVITNNFIFTNEARLELKQRFVSRYLPGFANKSKVNEGHSLKYEDWDTMIQKKDEFLNNPPADRYTTNIITGGAGTSAPWFVGKTRNIYLSGLYAYILDDIKVANVVAEEFLPRLLNPENDFDHARFKPDEGREYLDWSTTDRGNYFAFANHIKKMHQVKVLIENIQTIWTQEDLKNIDTYFKKAADESFKTLKGHLKSGLVHDDWINKGFVLRDSVVNPQYLHYPIEDANGNPYSYNYIDSDGNQITQDFIMSTFQESFYNNRVMECVSLTYTIDVHNNNIEREFYIREYLKTFLKYSVFRDGTMAEMRRNNLNDLGQGISYSNATLSTVALMCHLDAMANHFPNDRLYDYETKEGIVNGSNENSEIPYPGSTTASLDATVKSFKNVIFAQSNWLRGTTKGGWNDIRYFGGFPLDASVYDLNNRRFPRLVSTTAAIINLYYKDIDLKSYYTFDTSLGYPQKRRIQEGIYWNEDWGTGEQFIIGSAWIGQEINFFKENYFARENNTAKQAFFKSTPRIPKNNAEDAIKAIDEKVEEIEKNTVGYKSQTLFIDETTGKVAFGNPFFSSQEITVWNKDGLNDYFASIYEKGFRVEADYPHIRFIAKNGTDAVGNWVLQSSPAGFFELSDRSKGGVDTILRITQNNSNGLITLSNDKFDLAGNFEAKAGKFQSLEVPGYQSIEIINIPNGATYSLNRNTKIPALHVKEGSTEQSFSINYESIENNDVKHYKVMRGQTAGKLMLDNSGEAIPRCQIITPNGKTNKVVQGGTVDIHFISSKLSNGTKFYYWVATGDLEDILISETSQNFNAAGGSFDIIISTLHAWSIDDDSDWIIFSKTSGVGSDRITITVEANPTPEISRVTNIEISDSFKSEQLTIQQNVG